MSKGMKLARQDRHSRLQVNLPETAPKDNICSYDLCVCMVYVCVFMIICVYVEAGHLHCVGSLQLLDSCYVGWIRPVYPDLSQPSPPAA